MYFKSLLLNCIILFVIILNNQIINGSIISSDGDSIFGYFSDLVYDVSNYTKQYQFVSINGECVEWSVLLDTNRMMVFQSRLSNNLVISFKGTQSMSDLISDLNIVPIECTLSSSGSCGRIHKGFSNAYNEISDILLSVIESIDQPYDIYFTGHSLGGALAVLATMDYTGKIISTRQYIKSLHCVTFGQPGVGDAGFNAFMKNNTNKYIYRRYVNINHSTKEQDPIPNSLFNLHPNEPLYLNCNSNSCPLFQIGLHFLDLYNGNLFNQHYSSCNTNCKFIETNQKIYRYRQYHCPISVRSLVTGSFNPKGWLKDKYSVCFFNSKDQISQYKYKASESCNTNSGEILEGSVLVDKSKEFKSFSKYTGGDDLFIVVENHNAILSTSNFEYNISFSNPIITPKAPFNLSCGISFENEDFMNISVSFNSDNKNLESDQITYNVYVSEINKNWMKYQFIESVKTKSVSKIIPSIPTGMYSVVVTADNGLESHQSNYAFIYCKNCNNTINFNSEGSLNYY